MTPEKCRILLLYVVFRKLRQRGDPYKKIIFKGGTLTKKFAIDTITLYISKNDI